MSDKLKETINNYEKLHKLQMAETILDKMHSYVRDAISSVEDDFDYDEEFDDCIVDNIIKNIKEDIVTLQKYL